MKKTLFSLLSILFIGQSVAQENINKVVNTLKERITLSGYAQVGYTYNDAAHPDNTFDVKRIIFMADGKITNEWSCYFMYDFNASGNLLEVYTEYKFLPGLSARLGQFKTPYTIENQLSPSSVELINCFSLPTAYMAATNGSDPLCSASGGRDVGLMIHGDLFGKLLNYRLAVMNGQGINTKDRNSQKDVIGSLTASPTEWLTIGGSFVKGTGNAVATSTYIPGIKIGENYTRNRWSIGGILTGNHCGLRSEYLAGKDGPVKSNGFYATGYAQILPKLEVITSYEYLNRDKVVSFKQTNYVAGLQYWFYPRCRVQAQYTYVSQKRGEDSNLIQTQIQVRF